MPKARNETDSTRLFYDGSLLRIRVWEVAESVLPSEHRFKYSSFYGRPGKRRGRVSKELQVYLGDNPRRDRRADDLGVAPHGSWRRGERETHQLRDVGHHGASLVPKRLELMRHLHRYPAKSIRALSLALGRNYRRVHEDVEALDAAGPLDRDKAGLRADYDAFDVAMRMAL